MLSVVWGLLDVNFMLVNVSMASTLPAHSRDGPLHSLLGDVSLYMVVLVVAAALVIGAAATNAYCEHATVVEDRANDRRISLGQQKSKRHVRFASGRKLGYRAFRNQALCAWSFAMTAIMELLKWAADA